MANKCVLVLLVAVLGCAATLAKAAAIDDELEREKCATKAGELDNQLEEDGENLIEQVHRDLACGRRDCIREDSSVQTKVNQLIEKVKQQGEARECAKNGKSGDMKQAQRSQLLETASEIRGAMTDMDDRTMHLFMFILDTAEAEAKKMN